MHVRLSSLTERLRTSLFFVPLVSVVAAVVLAEAGILTDSRVDLGGAHLPLGVASTVESARAVLSTVAAATITFAGIAFSVSVLTIQLASSQYSPRVVHTLFRDPFNKRVMGLVVGTFTFCLVVLRSVRSSLEQDGTPVIPNLSGRSARHGWDGRRRGAPPSQAPRAATRGEYDPTPRCSPAPGSR